MKNRRRVRKTAIFVIVVLILIIALLISMIAKKTSDKKVSEPKQEKITETKKENKKEETNLPEVTKVNQIYCIQALLLVCIFFFGLIPFPLISLTCRFSLI